MQTEVLVAPDSKPWVAFAPGIAFRLLFASAETGRWTVFFKCDAGSSFGCHRHLGAGEYYVIKGRMTYRMGEAAAGSYGYEPIGALHEHTAFPEDTELLFTNYGPIAFLDEAMKPVMIVDHAMIEQLAGAG